MSTHCWPTHSPLHAPVHAAWPVVANVFFRFKRVMSAWNWTHRGFFEKKVALAHWRFLCKLRCLFKEVLCFDVLECESASSSLSKSDAVWMNGITGHFHGWLPRFSLVIIYPYVFWSVYLDVTMHLRQILLKKKMKCERLRLALNRSSTCFHWLTRLPATPLAWCWSQVGSLSTPAAVAKCLACFSCLALTGRCEKCSAATFPTALFFVCAICVHGDSDVWIKKGGGRMDLSLRYRNKKDIIDCRVRVLVTAIHGSAVHPSLLETPVYSHCCDTSSSLLPFSFNTTHIDVTRHFNLHTFSPEGQLWHNTFSPINQTYFLSYI